jgi:hypothetical protein
MEEFVFLLAFLYLRSLLDTPGHKKLSFSLCFLLCVHSVQCVQEYSSYVVERGSQNTINQMAFRTELLSTWTPDTRTHSRLNTYQRKSSLYQEIFLSLTTWLGYGRYREAVNRHGNATGACPEKSLSRSFRLSCLKEN